MEKYIYKYTETVQKVITPEEAYNGTVPFTPKGYEIADFRPVDLDETFLSGWGTVETWASASPSIAIRFILKKKPEEVLGTLKGYVETTVQRVYGRNSIVIPAGYKFEAFRPLRTGDTYLTVEGHVTRFSNNHPEYAEYVRIILTPLTKAD